MNSNQIYHKNQKNITDCNRVENVSKLNKLWIVKHLIRVAIKNSKSKETILSVLVLMFNRILRILNKKLEKGLNQRLWSQMKLEDSNILIKKMKY
jgi:hypothetical protein